MKMKERSGGDQERMRKRGEKWFCRHRFLLLNEGQKSNINYCCLKMIFFSVWDQVTIFFFFKPAIEGKFERTMGEPLISRTILGAPTMQSI